MGLSRRTNAAIYGKKRERMRANLRLGLAYAAGVFVLSPTATLAQEAPPTTNTPAADAVGPRELRGFSLKGTVTQQSDQPAQVPAATRPSRSPVQSNAASTEPRTATSAPARAAPPQPRPAETASTQPAPAQPRPESRQQSASSAPATPASSDQSNETASSAPLTSAAATAAPGFAPEPASLDLSPEHKFSFFPWLLAALALGAGGVFLFWRNRNRHAFAGGPQIDAFVAPEPAPAPRPAPAPPKAKSPPPTLDGAGIVSTRLRPWMDIGFNPARCILDNEKLVVEFEVELFNSGSAPARAVLVEASLLNAGPTQDEDIGKFFAEPVAAGERISVIAPLKRIAVKAQVAIGREQLQAYEAAGRQMIVPLIAFNVLYRWSGGEGQTSAGYLLGRETKGDKMAPFRIDLGPRIFRGVAARLLPAGVRS